MRFPEDPESYFGAQTGVRWTTSGWCVVNDLHNKTGSPSKSLLSRTAGSSNEDCCHFDSNSCFRCEPVEMRSEWMWEWRLPPVTGRSVTRLKIAHVWSWMQINQQRFVLTTRDPANQLVWFLSAVLTEQNEKPAGDTASPMLSLPTHRQIDQHLQPNKLGWRAEECREHVIHDQIKPTQWCFCPHRCRP